MRAHSFLPALLVCAAVLALAATGVAQSSILLASGEAVTCKLLSDDGSAIKVRRFSDKKEMTYSYAELHPRTVYRLMVGRTGREDAKGQMNVAAYALDHGFFNKARRHYRLAVAADERMGGQIDGQLKNLRERGAKTILAWAREHINSGEHVEAERWLGQLLKHFPNTAMADEASQLLSQHAEKAMAARKKKIESKTQHVDAEARKKLVPAKKHYDRAHGYSRRGLASTKSDVQARKLFEQALSEFRRARKTLAAVANTLSKSDPLREEIAGYDKAVVADMVQNELHIGSIDLFRGSLVNARKAARKALALDPNSADAKAMMGRIEVAANDDDRRGGRRR